MKRRRTTTTNVALSKKYVETARQGFAQVQEPEWRGLRVEYPSALPPQWNTDSAGAIDPQGCVAVLDVEQDSPAWKAGLRRGQYVSHVGSHRVVNPDAFYAAVAQETGDVRLQLTAPRGKDAIRIVAPESK